MVPRASSKLAVAVALIAAVLLLAPPCASAALAFFPAPATISARGPHQHQQPAGDSRDTINTGAPLLQYKVPLLKEAAAASAYSGGVAGAGVIDGGGSSMAAASSTGGALEGESLAALAQQELGWRRPWFCHGLDCPKFKLLEQLTHSIELREYEASRWMATTIEGRNLAEAYKIGLVRLLKYYAGHNEDRQVVRPAAPLAVRLQWGRSSTSISSAITVALFLPFDLQDDSPEPCDRRVHVLDLPGGQVFVQSFGGYPTSGDIIRRGAALVHRLQDEGWCVDEDIFIFGQYDPPSRLVGRHNEIWVAAAGAAPEAERALGDSGGAGGEQVGRSEVLLGPDGLWSQQD